MNKYFIAAAIVICVGLIAGVSTYKVVNEHNAKVLLVESKLIIEKAKKCRAEKKCNGEHITLKELYENEYLNRQVNEVTKEYYNDESYVEVNDSNYNFIIVN